MVLALIGALHALEVGHIRPPGVQTGAGAVDARLGVVARAGRPHRVNDAAVVGQHLVLDGADGFLNGGPGRGRDLVHRGVDQRIGRRAVLFVVFQVGVNGHNLGFPGFLCRRGAHKAADGTQLGVSNAHQAVHQVEFHIPAQALALDIQVRHGDGIFRAEQPAQAVFLLRREQGGIRPADGGGHRVDGLRDRLALRGALFLCKRRGDGPDQQHRRQQKRRRPAREHRNVFQDGFLLFSTISFSLV